MFGHCHIVNKDGRDLLADATYQYQGSGASDFRQEVLLFLQGLVISDKKKSFTNIYIEKLVTPPGGRIFKTVK